MRTRTPILRFCLTLLALAVCSMASAETITVWIHPQLKGRQAEIKAGLKMWSDVCNVDFKHVKDRKQAQVRFSVLRDWPGTERNELEEFVGYYYGKGRIELDLGHPDLEITTAHEIGHYVGWGHDPNDPKAVMWWQSRPKGQSRFSESEIKRAIQRFGKRKQQGAI